MMKTAIGAWLVAVVVAGASCGGGDAPNDAPAKCDALVTRLCGRAIACLADGTTLAECEAIVKTDLPCAQADRVSDGYPSCMAELQTSPCTVLTANNMLNLPATCNGSILFQ